MNHFFLKKYEIDKKWVNDLSNVLAISLTDFIGIRAQSETQVD